MLIHQESIIAAAPQAVYEVLTDGQKFAAATGMPAQLSDRVGEAFSLFGGRVEGRQIELVPGQRIVLAWILTLPCAAFMSAIAYVLISLLLRPIFGG